MHPHVSKSNVSSSSDIGQLPSLRQFLGVFRYSRRALQLVWETSRPLTVWLAVLTVVAGVLPAAVAYVGQLIVDSVVAASQSGGDEAGIRQVLNFVVLEGIIVLAVAAAQRGISVCQSLLRALLGQKVNVMILEKALQLSLHDFEDSEFYDKLTRARRDASQRPLSLVNRTFGLMQNMISLFSYAVLLVQFSPWAVVVLLAAGLPAFIAETKFSGDAFRLFRWRSPETRMQIYLETVLTREDGAKEVKLFQMGPRLLQRYKDIFVKLFKEDRALTLRRDSWGFAMGTLGSIAFYLAYAWIALSAVKGAISLGQMTMFLMVFRQGQSAVSAMLTSVGGMYEDNLYLSNLYEYLEQPAADETGRLVQGPDPARGIVFEDVSFQYPGTTKAALENINLQLKPGQSLALVGENGSGKTTLIKLLARLYEPTSGRILLDGVDLREWDAETLRQRIGVIFQDFGRYQFTVGENIGTGDVQRFHDEAAWQRAAAMAKAEDFIQAMPEGYQSQLGRWFIGGRELSGGQWQKIALARAFMREGADILVLDEPTAAIDARAEAEVFEHFRQLSRDKITILISHRFSTVRMADHIVVIEKGHVIEQGSHEQLMALDGHYAHLFQLQARGYQ